MDNTISVLLCLYVANPATFIASNSVLVSIFLWDQIIYSVMEKDSEIVSLPHFSLNLKFKLLLQNYIVNKTCHSCLCNVYDQADFSWLYDAIYMRHRTRFNSHVRPLCACLMWTCFDDQHTFSYTVYIYFLSYLVNKQLCFVQNELSDHLRRMGGERRFQGNPGQSKLLTSKLG